MKILHPIYTFVEALDSWSSLNLRNLSMRKIQYQIHKECEPEEGEVVHVQVL